MRREKWCQSLPYRAASPAIRSWLKEPASLTARLQKRCTTFRVRPLCQGLQKTLPDDAVQFPVRQVQVREVLLECDGQAVIFAHTILSTATRRGRLSLWLKGLGSRSLGSLLFAHPGFIRGSLEFARLDRRHALYRRAAEWADLPSELWARRSSHRLDGLEVVVTEVFLPAIAKSA